MAGGGQRQSQVHLYFAFNVADSSLSRPPLFCGTGPSQTLSKAQGKPPVPWHLPRAVCRALAWSPHPASRAPSAALPPARVSQDLAGLHLAPPGLYVKSWVAFQSSHVTGLLLRTPPFVRTATSRSWKTTGTKQDMLLTGKEANWGGERGCGCSQQGREAFLEAVT